MPATSFLTKRGAVLNKDSGPTPLGRLSSFAEPGILSSRYFRQLSDSGFHLATSPRRLSSFF
jgi:hypothetical protein